MTRRLGPAEVLRAAFGGVRAAARQYPGRSGIVAGVVVGALLTSVFFVYVRPVLIAPGPLEAGELVILSGRDDGDGGQRQALVDQWNALHPDNHARIEELPSVADAQRSEMVARAQSGRSDVDIYNLDVTWTAEFADNHYILALDDAAVGGSAADTRGFLRGPLQTCRYAGRLWGLPFNADAGLLYYRTDLLDGPPPATWDQLTAAIATALAPDAGKGSTGSTPKAGYAGQFADYEGLTVNALEAIWAAGGEVIDADGRILIDSREARTGLRRLAIGLAPASPQIMLPESTGYDERRTTQAFADGTVVLMRNWPVAYRTLDAPADPSPAARLPFDVARLPGPSVLGGQNLAIASGSDQPRAARALIEFLTSERSQQILFERGGFAATREIVYRDAEVVARYRYAPTLLQAIQGARPRPVNPHYAEFSAAFRRIVIETLHNGGDLPPDAADRLAAAVRGYPR